MNTDNADICKYCKGTGYSNREPVKCDCVSKICTRCEKNEGFLVHPYELCDYCCGTGSKEGGLMVLNLNKK